MPGIAVRVSVRNIGLTAPHGGNHPFLGGAAMINAREKAGPNVVVTMIFLPILDVQIKIILIPAAFPAAA